MRRTIGVDLAADARLSQEVVLAGGVFAAGASGALDEECNLVLNAGQEELRLVARIVMIQDDGVGLEIMERTPELREHIAAFARIAHYIATTRGAARHASDRVQALPEHQHVPVPARAGLIVERVRHVGYHDDDAASEPPVATARTHTLTGPLAAAEARRHAPPTPPQVDAMPRRVASGSIPPEPDTRRPMSELPIPLAPTQLAESLEPAALAAQHAVTRADSEES
jgi:hypothetical protein